MVTIVIAPDVQGAFAPIDGTREKDHGAINVVAQRISSLEKLSSVCLSENPAGCEKCVQWQSRR